jgi:hypothetical protein
MIVDYNSFTKVLTIKPVGNADLSYKDISIIKLVGPTDPNVCDSTSYSYNVQSKDESDLHKYTYMIANKGASAQLKPL